MTTVICQHCQAKNEAGTERCVVCDQPLSPAAAEGNAGPVEREEVEKWVRQLPEFGTLDAESLAHDDESLPAWLQAVRAHADKMTDQEADELLDFLADFEPEAAAEASEPKSTAEAGEPEVTEEAGEAKTEVAVTPAKSTGDLPDWVAALMPDESWPETEPDEELAEQLAELEDEDEVNLPSTAPLPSTSPLGGTSELKGIPELLASDHLPDWLASQESEEEPADTEEPPGWPGRSKGLRAASIAAATTQPATPEPAAPELPEASEPEPGHGLDSLDSILDEVAAAPEPADSADELSGFADWMDPVQASALEATLEEILDLPDADTSEGRVDQWLDILEGLPGGTPTSQAEAALGDADLDGAELPEWMDALGPQPEAGELEPVDLGPPEESGPLAGLRGVIPAAAISLSGTVDRGSTRLEMTKEQRQQAALLRRLTAAEPEAAATTSKPGDDHFLPARIILGVALLLVILLGLLVPAVADLLPQPGESDLPPAAVQAQEAIAASAGETALVAFDYTPSMAAELDPVASAIMADLAANDISVLTVSQVAAGVPMAEHATAANEDLVTQTIGYLPGEASGLRALGDCLAESCESVAGRQLDSEAQAALDRASLIVVLTADRDSLVGWIEQVGAQNDINIVGGVAQSLGPVAMPYLQSGQLAGVVEGLPVAAAYGEAGADLMPGLTLAQWLAIAVLLAGLIYFGFAAPAASAVGQVAKK